MITKDGLTIIDSALYGNVVAVEDHEARVAQLERELADCRRTCAELVTDGNAVTLAESVQRLSAENAELRAAFKCFRCGDGHTPLYCLNCADKINSPQIVELS